MSVTWTCDYCGREIGDDEAFMTISSEPNRGAVWRGGWVAHYHTAPGGGCYEQFRDLVDLARESAGNIAAIPVATASEIDRLRAGHSGSSRGDAYRSFAQLGIPARARNALVRAGLTSLDDIAARHDGELLRIPGVGPLTVEILRTTILSRSTASAS